MMDGSHDGWPFPPVDPVVEAQRQADVEALLDERHRQVGRELIHLHVGAAKLGMSVPEFAAHELTEMGSK